MTRRELHAYRLRVIFELKAEGLEPENIAERFGMTLKELVMFVANAKRDKRKSTPSTDAG